MRNPDEVPTDDLMTDRDEVMNLVARGDLRVHNVSEEDHALMDEDDLAFLGMWVRQPKENDR